MPGPLSSKVSRNPRRAPSPSPAIRVEPPPPWTRVLRASSLAAVTILVWSTRLKARPTAHWRVTCRTRTTSSSECTSSVCSRTVGIQPPARAEPAADQSHALLRVQRGANSVQVYPELDQGDGDRGPHAHHHGLRVQDARHAGDVGERAADEGVDDLQCRDVDEHPSGPMPDDLLGQLVLQ